MEIIVLVSLLFLQNSIAETPINGPAPSPLPDAVKKGVSLSLLW